MRNHLDRAITLQAQRITCEEDPAPEDIAVLRAEDLPKTDTPPGATEETLGQYL